MKVLARIGTILALAGLLLLPAAAASGAKPGCPGHPSCKPEPSTTTTMPDAGRCSGEVVDADTSSFRIDLTGDAWMDCRDVEWPAATWRVDVVAVSGRVNTLTVSVRDAVPGDWCAAERFKKPATGFLTEWAIPGAEIEICPDDGHGFGDDHPALAFMASFQGGQNAAITVEVTRDG